MWIIVQRNDPNDFKDKEMGDDVCFPEIYIVPYLTLSLLLV